MSTVRVITVFSTKGKQKAKIETDAKLWADLRPLVEAEGYDIENLHATENVNRTNLANEESVLPEGAFTIFLRPKKTKSGGCDCGCNEEDIKKMDHKQLKALVTDRNIKDFLATIKKGKNWTQLKTEQLRKGLIKFYCKGESSSEATIEEVSEVPEKVEEGSSAVSMANDVKVLLAEMCNDIEDKDICKRIMNISENVDFIIADIKSLAQDKEELLALIAEAKDIEDKSYKICN